MKAQPQHVEGLAEQTLWYSIEQRRNHAVGGNQVPVSVDGERRVRLMRLQNAVDRLARSLECGIFERTLRKGRGKSRGDQQHIALAQGNVQPFGELEHHVARGRGAAGFHEAQVTRGNLRIESEIELAEMTALAPFAQVISDMDRLGTFGPHSGGMSVHEAKLARTPHAIHYLAGNRFPLPAK